MRLLLSFLLIAGLNGCTPKPPQSSFGNHEPETGRETVFIKAPQSGTNYTFGLAIVDEVEVRQEAIPANQNQAAIEILVKGALPDGCTELHEAKQSQVGNQITVSLNTRRPTNAICTMALRPYRFYLLLDQKLSAGTYSLVFNEKQVPFTVKEK